MKNLDSIEVIINERIEAHRDEIIAIGRDIFHHAEPGWREKRTAQLIADRLRLEGMETKDDLCVTTVKGYLKGQNSDGPVVCLMGELDAVVFDSHPDAWSETGAAHVCGHNAQIAAVLGAAIGLNDPRVKEALGGNIAFLGVPAEEALSGEIVESMQANGEIELPCGKAEAIRRGVFDDVSIVLGHHLYGRNGIVRHNGVNNGLMNKYVVFHGVASHGASPFLGVDAQMAANVAFYALEAQRETFREQDYVRIHGFIEKSGGASNVIADEVRLSYAVRASNTAALLDAGRKFDRAMRAGAVAVGCGLTIKTTPGPMDNLAYTEEQCRCIDETLAQIDEYPVRMLPQGNRRFGSNDFGDVQHVLPAMRFTTGGVEGDMHTKEMKIVDEYQAYVMAAKVFALSAYKLLKNDAAYARQVMASWPATMSKGEYCDTVRQMQSTEELPLCRLPRLDG